MAACRRRPATVTSTSTWLSQGERGSVWGIRLAFRLATWVGRRGMRPLVSLVALWYRLFDRQAVRASRAWWTRVLGRPPGFWTVYRHIRAFAQVTLDRAFLLQGRDRPFVFHRTGAEHLHAQLATGRGAVLLGAHLGSYEAMCAGGAAERVPIHILGYFANARMINALLARLNPDQAARVIHLGDDPVGVMARVRGRVEQGDLVALMGDRTELNERVVRVRFFGAEAALPAGPFLLAALLHCPVYLVFGVYREPNEYHLYCEPFADEILLPRGQREERLREWVQRYASRLEDYAREHPDNWFNFFDFWRTT
jgi:predicted LPLAT superfamily acyltransferase